MKSFAKVILLLLASSSKGTAKTVFEYASTDTNTDTQSNHDATKSLDDYNPKCRTVDDCEAKMRSKATAETDDGLSVCKKCYAASKDDPFDECEGDEEGCYAAICVADVCEKFEVYCNLDHADDEDWGFTNADSDDGWGECQLRARMSTTSEDNATDRETGSEDDVDKSIDGPVNMAGLRGTNSCLGSGHNGNPEKYSPKRDGKSYNFNIFSRNAECRDSHYEAYEWGEFKNVKTATDCANKCVQTPDASVVTGGTFRGFDFACSTMECRCLYDAGTLNSKTKTSAYARTKTNQSGKGSIVKSQKKTDYYCAKLVGANAATLELAVE